MKFILLFNSNHLVLEIKEMPKFKDYDAGEPSNRLYIKNIDKKTTLEDLEYLFGILFNSASEMKENLEIKLMTTGRLKGQAFVTFKDGDLAKKSLQMINGYVINDKPLIIVCKFSIKEFSRYSLIDRPLERVNESDYKLTTRSAPS